jgi:hypothetical protein
MGCATVLKEPAAAVKRADSPDEARFNESAFRRFISRPASRLMTISERSLEADNANVSFKWPLLAAIRAEAEKLEEYLDIFGASNNCRWYVFRELTACIKNFADMGYRFCQVRNCFSRFSALSDDRQLAGQIVYAHEIVRETLMRSMQGFLRVGKQVGMDDGADADFDFAAFGEKMPRGTLRQDRAIREGSTAAERAGALATQFLNLAVDSVVLARVQVTDAGAFTSLFPELINEESLRKMEFNFHNLQSLYDTYICDTDAENVDDELRQLRGHISVILHLLEAATLLGHFYERHYGIWQEDHGMDSVVDFAEILRLLRSTLITTHSYVEASREICHAILRKYTRTAEVAVPIPSYRGFHVRPSALVMKIVTHYGTEVKMRLGNSEYNAASALDMMRANEWVNALKRRAVAELVAKMPLEKPACNEWDLQKKVSKAIHQMAENNYIVVYERPLDIGEVSYSPDLPVSASVLETVKLLLFTGKIDVETEITATFVGDERPLNDIEVLAANQYCEDSFGNNIPLPPELPYLRR